jgi:prolipoprotein diacylglyceryl transferase
MPLPFSSPGPILFDFGVTQIRWYGLMTALGCLTAIYAGASVLKERALKKNLSVSFDDFSNFALVAVVTGIIGARAWFVLLNIGYFWEHPLESYQIWLGGQSIQGGLIGGILGTWVYSYFFQNLKANSENKNAEIGRDENAEIGVPLHTKIERVAERTSSRLRRTNDRSALGVHEDHEDDENAEIGVPLHAHYSLQLSALAITAPLGQAIGRWGNFFNEEAFGSVTSLPWALYISHTGKYHHPTFLYEMIWNLISFSILINTHKKLENKQCIGLYFILYSLGRIFIEQLRTDSLYIGPIKAASLISALGIALGLALLWHKRKVY